jgi:hypothetical protein
MKRKTILLGLFLLLCSCTTTCRISHYDLNKDYITKVGSPMVVREKCWGDSYYQAATLKNCIVREELACSGREGYVIHMTTKNTLGKTVTIHLRNPSYKSLVLI